MRAAAAKCANASSTGAPETVFGDLGFGEGTDAQETGVDAAVGGVEEHGAGGIDGRHGFRLYAVGDVD